MEKSDNPEHNKTEEIFDILRSFNKRLSAVEFDVGIKSVPHKFFRKEGEITEDFEGDTQTQTRGEKNSILESKFGEYGLGWIGNIVLLFGITFLVQYIHNLGYQAVSGVISFILVGVLLIVSRYLQKSLPSIAYMFKINGQFLLFLFILRLHYFTSTPLIDSKNIILIATLLLVGILFYLNVRKNSRTLTGLNFMMLLATAIVSNSNYLFLSLLAIAALSGIILFFKLSCLNP